MSFNFAHLDIKKDFTADYEVTEIDTPEGTLDSTGAKLRHPRLKLVSATKSNKPYWNLALKKSGRRQRSRIEDVLEDELERDIELFPKYVIKGWEGVFNTDGELVPFSESECAKFMAALPDWIVNNIRIFAKDHTNFISDDEPSDDEVEEQGNV